MKNPLSKPPLATECLSAQGYGELFDCTRRRITTQLYIRPVYKATGGYTKLVAVAVCTTNGKLHVDEQVDAWFEADASGREIREWYKDHEFTKLTWGDTLTYQGT